MKLRFWNSRRWNSIALAVIATAIIQLSAPGDTGRFDDPWPVLLTSGPLNTDPGFAALQQRANLSLQRAMHPAEAFEQPL